MAQPAEATEGRLALLVGHQYGWKGEPSLDYVLSGDLRPLGKQLRALGFEVKQVENQGPQQLRAIFQKVKAHLQRNPHIQTFIFYYSGHADQRHFHLGQKGAQPLSYQEFSTFFQGLPLKRKIAIFDSCYSGEIIRRFGSLTRYKKLLKKGKTKGIRARRRIDLHKLIIPKQGHEQGVRIIASSLDVSWELREHKASVFTHYMLKGLKGAADTDQDGKITVDELFDFTSKKVLLETGQRPQQLLLLKRSLPYAIAPVYRSRLRIGPNVTGHIKVAVANFVWSRRKQTNDAIKLAVVDGQGTVFLKRKGRCFQQSLRFPKGGEVQLSARWRDMPCKRLARKQKGALYLEAQTIEPKKRQLPPWSLALSAGFVQTQAALLQSANWGGGFHLRLGKLFGAGLHVTTGSPDGKDFWLTTLWLRPELGWSWPFRVGPFGFDVFLGAYAQIGLTFQHTDTLPPKYNPGAIFVAGAGASFDVSWWWTEYVGLRVGALAGFNYTPVKIADDFSFQWQLQTSLLFAF